MGQRKGRGGAGRGQREEEGRGEMGRREAVTHQLLGAALERAHDSATFCGVDRMRHLAFARGADHQTGADLVGKERERGKENCSKW